MTHISVTCYEFTMRLLGLLEHGWRGRGERLCNLTALPYSFWQKAHQRHFSLEEKGRVKEG